MGQSGEKITRTEKFKIAGLIGVAVFVVSMIIWSAFETHIRYLVAGFFESLQNFFLAFSIYIAWHIWTM